MYFHKFSLTELEEMLPWEREVYVTMLMNHLKEEEDRQKQKQFK